MNSSGDLTGSVVPSRDGVVTFSTTRLARRYIAHGRKPATVAWNSGTSFQPLTVVGFAAHGDVQAESLRFSAKLLFEPGFRGMAP